MAKSKEYWKRRFEKLEDDAYRTSKAYYDDLAKQFRRASNEIEMEIASWYYRVAENNEISYSMAKRYLNRKELKEFRWTVEEYIKFGKENALDQKWMKELENASARVHITRLETVKIQLQQLIERLFIEYEGGTSDLLNKTYKSSYYKSAYEIAKGTGVGKTLHALDDNLVSDFLRKPWAADGKDFSSRIWKNKEELVQNLHTELTQQLVRGSDPGKTIDAIAKRMDVSKSKAGNLVMTETAAIHSMAQSRCFKDLDVEKYEIIVTMDIKTSQICRDIDKKYHNVGIDLKDYQVNVTAPPFHCRCRTCACPFFDDEFTEDSTRIARDPITGKTYHIPADMTYQEWYDKYVASNPDALLAEKRTKNRLADQKQYDQYKSILGKDAPKNLDDFQNLKYTNIEKWETLKKQYSETFITKDYDNISSVFKANTSDLKARQWYKWHDENIPNIIDKNTSIEQQARRAHELRNTYRTQTRDLMKDQEKRRQLDIDYPNKTFEELIDDKINRKNITKEEAIKDILDTATKTNKVVNKSLGLE